MGKEIVIGENLVYRQIIILAILFFSLFLIGTAGFMIIKHTNVINGFVQTVETISFQAEYGGTLAEKMLQIFLYIFGVIVVWWTLWRMFDLTLEGKFQEHFRRVKHMKKISRLKNHYIICGAGRVGMCVANELKKNGKSVVMAEKDNALAEHLHEDGFLVVKGSSVDEDTLIKAGIKNASGLIAATGDDGKNIIITLNAKELNPDIVIGARVGHKNLIKKIKHAGAKYVVLPEVLGGTELANEIIEHAAKK